MMAGLSTRIKVIAGLLGAAVAAGLVAGCSPDAAAGDDGENIDKLFAVRRSDLVIGTLVRGTANAKEKHKLFPEASYRNVLTWIADENTHVKKGDVVIKFETQDLLDDIESRKLNIETQQKTLDIKREEKRILLSENVSALRVAKDRVDTAEEDYARYYKYDGKKEKEDKVESVDAAEKNFEEKKREYLKMQDEIINTIYDDEDARQKALAQLDKLKDDMRSKEKSYKDAAYSLRIFKKYTYPNKLRTKKNALDQARLNYEKVVVSTASRVVQKDNDINRVERALKKDKNELERIESYLPMMEIKAPVDGILIYGDVDRRNDRRIEIEVGMEVRRKRVIATIPEMDNLIVNFELPEQFRHRVSEGNKVIITPDSMPQLKVPGKISEIAVVPVHQIEWDRTSPKIYHAVVSLDQQNKNLVSGMNVQIDIIEAELSAVLNVPIEAVFEEEGEYFVYLRSGSSPRKQVVQLGKSNDQYVQIVEGLSEGDQVYLFSPYKLDAME